MVEWVGVGKRVLLRPPALTDGSRSGAWSRRPDSVPVPQDPFRPVTIPFYVWADSKMEITLQIASKITEIHLIVQLLWGNKKPSTIKTFYHSHCLKKNSKTDFNYSNFVIFYLEGFV